MQFEPQKLQYKAIFAIILHSKSQILGILWKASMGESQNWTEKYMQSGISS